MIGAFSKASLSDRIDELSILLCLPPLSNVPGLLVAALAAGRMSSVMKAPVHSQIWRVGLHSGVMIAHFEPYHLSMLGTGQDFLVAEYLVWLFLFLWYHFPLMTACFRPFLLPSQEEADPPLWARPLGTSSTGLSLCLSLDPFRWPAPSPSLWLRSAFELVILLTSWSLVISS